RKMEYRYPVIGVGGVMSAEDIQRLLDAGASLVQCYSAVVYEGPGFAGKVCRKLATMTPADAQPQ
ncbi:MAG: quinone-dependent dihydroorotate dehydrogenase, partial [Tidjanibacter sp.]|nr:quinone-dependent dihydroorotate dehydrogenase [Tidjanibacter sp.]